MTSIDCSNWDVENINELELLQWLESLNLEGNELILCEDLDYLESQLPNTSILRPENCNDGNGGYEEEPVHMEYVYNALGQRVIKTRKGVFVNPDRSVHFIYDQLGQVIAEIDGDTGETMREYIYVNGQQVAIVDDTGTTEEATYFVHTDHLGTPQKITDDSQAVVWNAAYLPFGEVEITTAAIENNVRFPGQYSDAETGLHYNYFRDYEPSMGRYLKSDPVGIQGGFNLYTYAWADPIHMVDIYGLTPLDGTANFFAGFGDSVSLGLTKYIRESWNIDGGINSQSGPYKTGVYTELALETSLMASSFAMKSAAKTISQSAARRGLRHQRGVKRISELHHVNPLKQGLFPTAPLPIQIRHSRHNLKILKPADHRAAHRALRRHETYLTSVFNPVTTSLRLAIATPDECDCR